MVQNIQSTKTLSMTEVAKAQQKNVADSKNLQMKATTRDQKTAEKLQKLTSKPAVARETILYELKQNPYSSSLTARQVADKYGIPLVRAQEILDEINANQNGIVKELNLPENSTVSYRV